MSKKFSKSVVIVCITTMILFLIYNCVMYAILQQTMDSYVITAFLVSFVGELITLAWRTKDKKKDEGSI